MDWDLLHASLKFWDREDHVFRFNLDEICPTIEDFLAILGADSSLPTVIPTLQNSYTSSMGKLFNPPTTIILRIEDIVWSGFADMRISTLIPQLLDGKSLVPIVIVETMNGLDAMYRGETDIFRRSPLLLQVWLMDRLALIVPPTMTVYEPKHYLMRNLVRQDLVSMEDYLVDMCRRSCNHIRWSCPWWKNGMPILRACGRDHVSLFGLGHTSFYRGD
ncbi:hypothetical protein FCV25MIE_15150 [Fagus crenata]